MNIRSKLTLNPETDAGKELLNIGRKLLHIGDKIHADE
jgi:hypothetical protein